MPRDNTYQAVTKQLNEISNDRNLMSYSTLPGEFSTTWYIISLQVWKSKSERASLSTTMVFLCFFLKGCFLNLSWEVTWSEASEYSQLVTCWQEQSNSCSHTLPSCFRRGPDSNPSFGDINQSSIVFGTQICNLRSTYFMCQTSSSLNARNTTFYINKAVWGSWGTNHGRDTCQALSGG